MAERKNEIQRSIVLPTFILVSILSGIAAACASVFAKLAADTSPSAGLIHRLVCQHLVHPSALCAELAVMSKEGGSSLSWQEHEAFIAYRQVGGDQRIAIFGTETTGYIPNFGNYTQWAVYLRMLWAGCVLASNGIMWLLFTKALALSPSSIHVTILNSAANMCATALMGNVFFQDRITPLWWVGAGFVLVGSVLLTEDTDKSTEKKRQ